jgi:mono/diheme cytochrome c family protein
MTPSAKTILRLLFAAALAGCAGTQLPLATDADAVRAGTTVAALNQGRTAYLDHCASCHPAIAPTAKPAAQWPRFVNEMASRSKLDRAQADAVIRYLMTAAQRGGDLARK